MASAPEASPPVIGRVDAAGCLVEADPPLAALQIDAGSEVGRKLALPQLAAVVRLVRNLGISVTRQAIAGARDHDVEMWVRAEPDGNDVVLHIEKWKERPPAPSRFQVAAGDDELIGRAAHTSWQADAELRLTSISADLAEWMGADSADAVGQPLTRFLRLEENDDGLMPLLTGLAARAAFAGQAASAKSGGGPRLLLSGEPIEDGNGKFVGFRGRAAPGHGTRPEGANESAGHSIDPALDQALRSPLARIIAAAEGIVERADGPLRSDYATYAGDIAAAAQHLLAVIRSMADQPVEVTALVDLVALAAEAIALVQPQADDKQVSLVVRGETVIQVRGDRRGVIQILVNLLGNAVRHSPEGGTVTLDLVISSAMGEASIADQGKGIAEEDQERIFEKFERLENGGGAGLGLAIARRLARSMSGDVTLKSTTGKGASFTLALPLG